MSKFDKIVEIIQFNEILEKQYNILAELEIAHKINNEEYKKTLANIKMILAVHDKKIKELDVTDEELINYNDSLVIFNHYDEFDGDFISCLCDLATNNKIRRTCADLSLLQAERNAVIVDEEVLELYDGMEEEVDTDIFDESDVIAENTKIDYNIETVDYELKVHTFMTYLIECINQEKRSAVKRELIRVKYRLIYLSPEFEQDFLSNPKHFINVEKTHFDFLELYKLYYDTYNEEYLEGLNALTKIGLEELLDFDEENQKNARIRACFILRTIYVKTYLSINYSKQSLNEIVDYANTLKNDIPEDDACQYINEAFVLRKDLALLKDIDFSKLS